MGEFYIHYIGIGRVRDQSMILSYLIDNSLSFKRTEIDNHCAKLLEKQNNPHISDIRGKSEYMNFAWHIYQDKNSILYIAVTHREFGD